MPGEYRVGQKLHRESNNTLLIINGSNRNSLLALVYKFTHNGNGGIPT